MSRCAARSGLSTGLLLTALLALACGSVEPGGGDGDGDGGAGTVPDAGGGRGGPDAAPDAAASCQPSTTICADDSEVVCDAAGRVASLTACPIGCHPDGERCLDVDPSNGLGLYLDEAAVAPDVVLGDGAVIRADDGQVVDGDGSALAIPTWLLAASDGGAPVRVLVVASLATGDLVISGSPAVAIISAGDVLVAGQIQVRAGRNSDEDDACAGKAGDACLTGGGGGGFGQRGGDGGALRAAGGDLVAGGDGAASSGAADLQPLRGGCAGGAFGGVGGGDGGGALQVVSRTAIVVRGSIAANGSGGSLTGPLACSRLGIGGGGSGGGILLEAPRVELSAPAALVANGGGGGCRDAQGEDGASSESGAPAGQCDDPDGDGGGGGARGGSAGGGLSGSAEGGAGGGGGGGAGRIRVNSAFDGFAVESGAVVSPAATVGPLGTR
jgi:hypothetical protein